MAPAGTTTARPRQRRGSARSTARPPGRPPGRSGARRAVRAARIRWERVGRVGLLVVLAVVLGLYVQQGLAYLSVRSQANHQAALVRQLSRENAQLVGEEKSLNDPATIVRYARQLGMVKAGERPYVVTGLSGGSTGSPGG